MSDTHDMNRTFMCQWMKCELIGIASHLKLIRERYSAVDVETMARNIAIVEVDILDQLKLIKTMMKEPDLLSKKQVDYFLQYKTKDRFDMDINQLRQKINESY